MPLYETVMQEKPPVVLDIGNAYTKLGFAAEAYPRKIIPSKVILSSSGQTKNLLEYANTNDLYDQFVDFLQMIFFKHLLVIPKERKVVIVENILGQTVIRETLARVLFRHFEVSSIMFVPLHMIALATLAVPTGIVVDMGYTETTVMPVYCRVQILQAFQDQAYGGRAVHAEIKRQLLEMGGVNEKYLTESVLEDIKVRSCFVTTFERAKLYRKGQLPSEAAPSIEYPINGEDIITIPGSLRETVFEIMFEENNDRDSLPHLILRSILTCPVDVRRSVIESIFVVGGSAIIMGLLARLKCEMQYLAENDDEYKVKLCGDIKFKFHKTIGRENFTAWLGGSLCGGTDLIQTHSLTKETYVKTDRVPDWISLADKRSTGS